ncbi:MAG: HAD family hydrolase [Alphaproteobacteria bacterium]|jgi:phosphoglycolate phosphatase|nr:HAD family hydrolase [Alphaproteobacteria bacterium]
MAIRGILFDKDGTLLDFFETWAPAYRAAVEVAADIAGDPAMADRMLRATGFEPESGIFDPESLLAGGTTAQICDAWADEAGIVERGRFSHLVHEAMDDYAARYPVPIAEGLDVLFERLAGRGYALGIATMDSEVVAQVTAETLGLSRWLTFLAGYNSGHGVKPEPGMVLGFCAAAGLTPAEVLVIGDTDRDINMARNAGAGLVVGVLTGASPAERLVPIADRVLESVFEIETLLGD